MKQYCRYCSHCNYGDVAYCEKLKRTMSDEKAKRINQCKDFDFLEIDVFNPDNSYKVSNKSLLEDYIENKGKRQMNIFEIKEELENDK